MKTLEQSLDESNAYSLFVYAIRSQVTRDYYVRRLRIFFNHINFEPDLTMEERCNSFANKGTNDPSWAFNCIVKFLQYQKERVEKQQITGATLRNFIKAIKLFCEMSDIPIQWKKITRGLPKIRRHADDRAPTIEEIQQLCEYPDRRIKGIVYTMASSGIRLGAWDYLRWKDIHPIERQGKVVAAKIIVYAGDDEEYFSFITAEAYNELQKWMQYRQDGGEEIHKNSWIMRQLWDTKKGYYHHGTITNPEKLKPSGIKRLMEDALWTQGIRKKRNLKKNRYEFQTDHGLRKWFKTRCEISGMKSINIEILMSHSIGISDSYYKITEDELLTEYLKASNYLIINNENQLQKQYEKIQLQNHNDIKFVERKLFEKENEIEILNHNDQNKSDAIAALADRIEELILEIEQLKKERKINN
jgi:hypothetical protein